MYIHVAGLARSLNNDYSFNTSAFPQYWRCLNGRYYLKLKKTIVHN